MTAPGQLPAGEAADRRTCFVLSSVIISAAGPPVKSFFVIFRAKKQKEHPVCPAAWPGKRGELLLGFTCPASVGVPGRQQEHGQCDRAIARGAAVGVQARKLDAVQHHRGDLALRLGIQ